MKRSFLVPLLAAVLLLGGCNIFSSTSYDDMRYRGGDMVESYESAAVENFALSDKSMMPSPIDGSYDADVEDRKLIKTADLSLHVESVRAAEESIESVVEGLGGDVTNSSVTRGDRSYWGYVTVKVPVDTFEEALTGLKALAIYVESEYTNSSDVTEYYMDLQARLTNKQAEEKQYLEILGRAVTVEETLMVTQALSNVRYEIESLQGQIKSYDSQIDYSTINVSLTEDESVEAATETWNPGGTFEEARSNFVVFLQGLLDLAIYVFVFGWPLLVIGLVLWLVRRSRRGGKR